MKKNLLSLITLCLLVSKLQAGNDTDSTKKFFRQAFVEVKNMLEEKQPLNFERAVFVTENAYRNNKFSYEDFQYSLGQHVNLIQKLISSNNQESKLNFKTIIDPKPNTKFDINLLNYTEGEKKEMYRKTLANWAIYKYMTDTTYFYDLYRKPFTYQINDPFGMKDWKNSQVTNLLSSPEQKGNCFALTSLFKIFSERLNSDAYISVAPQHIYIQHKDHKGDFYNIELATGTYPGDGSLQTLTYTQREAIISGIALRRLNNKETIALCLVNLGKSFEHKYGTRDDDFILQCAELALKYDSLSLNALLLKEQVLEEKVINTASQKKITDISKLVQDKNFIKLEKLLVKLYDLGYRQMPRDMQEMILAGLQRKDNQPIIVQDQTPRPFASIKTSKEDTRYSTLSAGLFEEVHEPKKIEQYGRVFFNTQNRKISKLDQANNNEFLIDPVVFAWSVDPLAHKMPGWSPYAAFADNPILYVDEDGRFPYTFHVRSFIPTTTAGGGLFRGDGRGFSTAQIGVTSRIRQQFTIDTDKAMLINKSTKSDFTLRFFPLAIEEGKPTGTYSEVSQEKNSFGNTILSFNTSYAGSDPLAPFAPDVDVKSMFSVTENKDLGILSVAGSISGDKFPSTESFISDASGQSVFLGVRGLSGNEFSLFGEGNKQLIDVNFQINIDKSGNFTGVRQGDKNYSISDWNKGFESKDATCDDDCE